MAGPVPDAVEQQVLRQIVDVVKEGSCTLFLGAGVHARPPDQSAYGGSYQDAERPPIGNGLAEELAGRSGWATRYPDADTRGLQRVSLDYELMLGRKELERAVREAVDEGKRPSPVVRALAEIDFPIVITTNYDRLFEAALRKAGKEPQLRVYHPTRAVADFTGERPEDARKPWLFKIHGDVDHADSIVITDEDYIEFVLNMGRPKRPVPDALEYLLIKRPTLFVGYSLLDYNLRLLFRTLRHGWDKGEIPRMYSVDYRPDPLILQVWQHQKQYLSFLAQDVWKFVPALYREVTGREMPA